ncbi:LysR family transcriptional regulator [Pseudomonas sp. v388]|uniref:LysR family transcriptional regulator n=1 Tax=Pseudomonas sp. v388 TaxID=2479849 RepID=UPI000F7B0B23|nr:LysR family transcriptional regulator [Pseudomonas sp. v388]RRV06838.1 LysR family transcriptional regulator [Pseudomonas sp. v388]
MSDIEDLAAFAVLIEAGSFTAAAVLLGCSKGRLSKRISQLEKSYSVQLLHRTTRRLSLTSAGMALLPQARQLLEHAQRARNIAASMRDEMVGEIRITVPVSLGETFCEGLLTGFAARYPHVRIELDLQNAMRDLRREGFDLAIRGRVDSDERLVARPLLVMQELTCASPAYLDRLGVPGNPEQLAGHRCLLNSHSGERRQWLYHRGHELTRVEVDGPFASNHYSLLKKAALAAAGIARLPSYMVHDEIGDGRLRWLFQDYRTSTSPLLLVHPYESEVPKRVQVLADYLLEWFRRTTSTP